MGTRITLRQATARSTAHARLPVLLALLLALGLLAYWMVAPEPAGAETVANAAGRYDGLVLRDLGGKRAALVCLIAENGAFTPVELWRSKAGAFDARKAKFLSGDVNGDGIADGIALYDLGSGRARLSIWLSDGHQAVLRTAWTAKAGAFSWARAKLAVGDLDRDGKDDVIALYDRGRGAASLYRFISTGKAFRQSLGWSGALAAAGAQLAAGDLSGDGRADAVVLAPGSATSASLLAFVSGSSKFSKKTFWKGAYAAGRARLSAGDADSDGKCDVISLYRKPNGTGRLDVFRSTGKAFLKPAVWYDGAAGALPAAKCRLAAGDVTGDGRADVVLAQPSGGSAVRVTTCVSSGARFQPRTWWSGGWAYAAISLGVSPSQGVILAHATTVVDASTLAAIREVRADGTLVFAGATTQLDGLRVGDVLVAGVSGSLPQGFCGKVTRVSRLGGQVVVSTAPAGLADVFDKGQVALALNVTRGDLTEEGIVATGVTFRDEGPLPRGIPGVVKGWNEGIGFDITTTIGGKVEIAGAITLNPDAYLDWDVDLFPPCVNSLAFTQVLTTTTDLSVSLKASIDKEYKQTIFKQTLTPITIVVALVPIVITPEFEVYVGASGEVSAGVTAGVSLTTLTTFGVAYSSEDGPSVTSGFSHTVTWQKPQLTAAVELKAFGGAGLSFEVWGIIGPTAKVEPYLALNADLTADPWWVLSAGLDGEVGVVVIDDSVFEKTYTLHLFEYVIDQAGSDGSGGGGYEEPSVRGKILEAGTADPLRNASVELREGTDGPRVAETRSAADGSYLFSGIEPGSYTLSAGKGGYADNSRSVTVVDGQVAQGQDVSLTPYEDQGVSGRVLSSPDGMPLHGADVLLFLETEDVGSALIDSTTAEDDGSFSFVGVPPGKYYLYSWDYEHFADRLDVTVTAGRLLTGQDLHLVSWDHQGVGGRVTSALDGSPVAGATVRLNEGTDASAGPMYRQGTTAADGGYLFAGAYFGGIETGDYTLVASAPGYLEAQRNVTVTRGRLLAGQDLELAPYDANGVARTVDQHDFIRYPMFAGVMTDEGALMPDDGTFELWFKPSSLEPGHLTMVTLWYGNWPGNQGGNGAILWLVLNDSRTIEFWINEGTNEGPGGNGTYHGVIGVTRLEIGQWYHVAGLYGDGGMQLYVNGHLEDGNTYEAKPQASWSDATLAGGWVSIGDNETWWPGFVTAQGSYKELRVSSIRMYDGDFTPEEVMGAGTGTTLLDHLIGGTTGSNHGLVWVE
jgi:hypothetical protein